MDKYGLIGFPLGHSFSRGFFTEKFAREGIDAEYVNFEIPDASMLLASTSRCLTSRLSSLCSTN